MQELLDRLNAMLAQQAELSVYIADAAAQLKELGHNVNDANVAGLKHRITAAGWDWQELVSKSRRQDLVIRRAICYDYLQRKGLTLKFIGKIFGGRDHSTIINGLCVLHDCKISQFWMYEEFKSAFYGEQNL